MDIKHQFLALFGSLRAFFEGKRQFGSNASGRSGDTQRSDEPNVIYWSELE